MTPLGIKPVTFLLVAQCLMEKIKFPCLISHCVALNAWVFGATTLLTLPYGCCHYATLSLKANYQLPTIPQPTSIKANFMSVSHSSF